MGKQKKKIQKILKLEKYNTKKRNIIFIIEKKKFFNKIKNY